VYHPTRHNNIIKLIRIEPKLRGEERTKWSAEAGQMEKKKMAELVTKHEVRATRVLGQHTESTGTNIREQRVYFILMSYI
jgi:hypothetical protein